MRYLTTQTALKQHCLAFRQFLNELANPNIGDSSFVTIGDFEFNPWGNLTTDPKPKKVDEPFKMIMPAEKMVFTNPHQVGLHLSRAITTPGTRFREIKLVRLFFSREYTGQLELDWNAPEERPIFLELQFLNSSPTGLQPRKIFVAGFQQFAKMFGDSPVDTVENIADVISDETGTNFETIVIPNNY